MAAPGLVPCLITLRSEFNTVAPERDKASDGWVGDSAHQDSVSDHNWDETGSVPIRDPDKVNEVHAIDVDDDLRESDLTMERVVQFLLGRCRSGAEKRLRYIIYNRRIWSASSGWVQKTYTGASPHTEHAHFSASYETKLEASTASWHLEDIPVALTAADKAWITSTIGAQINAAVVKEIDAIKTEVLAAGDRYGSSVYESRTLKQFLDDLHVLRDVFTADPKGTEFAKTQMSGKADSPVFRIIRAADAILAQPPADK